MSRTDKDRPTWVIRHVEDFHVDHDHRHGECVIETLADAQEWNGNWRRGGSHWARCRKHRREEYECTKLEAEAARRERWNGFGWNGSHGLYFGDLNDISKQCWITYKPRDEDGHTLWSEPAIHVGCRGHKRWVDTGLPCVCDTWTTPTCSPAWYGAVGVYRYAYYGTRGKSAVEYTHNGYHCPERRRARDELREWAKAWNAGDELEDWDYANWQGRHSVQWDMY